jgi:hypothetical protein
MDASFEAQRPLLHRISALIFRPAISMALLVFIGLLPAVLVELHLVPGFGEEAVVFWSSLFGARFTVVRP